MRVGSNWSYDGSTQETRDIFKRLKPDSVVIMSHAAEADYIWIANDHPSCEFVIRAKTGPGHLGTYPSDILDYREWNSERSLREALAHVASYQNIPLRVILGNEPDIEMAAETVDDPGNRREAITNYVQWYTGESAKIRQAFPGVLISPAPLSQGNRDRWLAWAMDMHKLFRDADFIACHCYTPDGTDFDDPDWGGQWRWYRSAYADKPIVISETNQNGPGDAQRMAAYIQHVAATGEVEEVDLFTLPGGAQDASAPQWWFITEPMADVIATADRRIGTEYVPPEIIVDPIEPAPVEASMTRTDDEAILECRRVLWLAINPGLPWNPDAALTKYWMEHIAEMGSPVSPELDGADNKYQGFARGVWRWLNDGNNTIEKIAA